MDEAHQAVTSELQRQMQFLAQSQSGPNQPPGNGNEADFFSHTPPDFQQEFSKGPHFVVCHSHGFGARRLLTLHTPANHCAEIGIVNKILSLAAATRQRDEF